MSLVSIVICWKSGTEEMLTACLKGIQRHTHDVDYEVVLVDAEPEKNGGNFTDTISLKSMRRATVPFLKDEINCVHGKMLDHIVPGIKTKYILTLDSDCFPVADGWLSELIKMLEDGASLAGILHPWAPPPSDLPKNKIEYRIRAQHCWETTHVACQLIETDYLRKLIEKGCKFNGGDDTGLLIPAMVKEDGGKISGFKPTRCPIPWTGELDPEFNRYVCLVYGDKVYHHGGFSRKCVLKDQPVFGRSFMWCEKLVLWGHGAEFLLDDNFSYKYAFDREEEVAKEKMQRLFGFPEKNMSG